MEPDIAPEALIELARKVLPASVYFIEVRTIWDAAESPKNKIKHTLEAYKTRAASVMIGPYRTRAAIHAALEQGKA